MNTNNKPVSEILKNNEVDEPKKRTREDWRKAKELEEARKAGTAPAAVDEEGRDINPHIPQYISSAPWYFGAKGPTLKHQRPQPEKQADFTSIDGYYQRGIQTYRATKFRKGACENCGAMTHKKKDCVERPRKVGAKYSNDDIAPDEAELPDLSLDYDGKRDRWNGFQPEAYQAIVDEFAKVEEAKRQLKEDKLKEDLAAAADLANREGGSEDDEDKYADDADMPGTKVDSKQRITVRNLRIREDVAKYLRNLDPNSAYYDPKTRSMRDNPYKTAAQKPEELVFAGDNFVRYSGDTVRHSSAQTFAWQAYEKGVDVHLQAEPTKAELLNQEFGVKKDEFKQEMKESILERYGGEEHLQAPPKELIFAQTEEYIEYARDGQILKGNEKPVIRSKYEEDIYPNNHTSVWGSYWNNGRWGYKCCHSFVKQSYCTGEAGKDANTSASQLLIPETEDMLDLPSSSHQSEQPVKETPQKSLLEQHVEALLERSKQTKNQKKKQKKRDHRQKKRMANKKKGSDSDDASSGSEASEAEEEDDETKLKKALEKEDANQREGERLLSMDERKRPYNSMYEVKGPTDEEMEAYFLKRARPEDPMSAFLGKKA